MPLQGGCDAMKEGSEDNQKKDSELADSQIAAGRSDDEETDKQSQMLGHLKED
jgi:hypothetical protein